MLRVLVIVPGALAFVGNSLGMYYGSLDLNDFCVEYFNCMKWVRMVSAEGAVWAGECIILLY